MRVQAPHVRSRRLFRWMGLITYIKLGSLFLKWSPNLFELELSNRSAEKTEVLPFHFVPVSLILPSWLWIFTLLFQVHVLPDLLNFKSFHRVLRHSGKRPSELGFPQSTRLQSWTVFICSFLGCLPLTPENIPNKASLVLLRIKIAPSYLGLITPWEKSLGLWLPLGAVDCLGIWSC